MADRRRIAAGTAALAVYGVILLLSSLPPSRLPSGVPDIIPHAAEYALLAFFLVQAFRCPSRLPARAGVFLLAVLLGLLDELHQLSTPGRVFSWLDLLYDALGAVAGMQAHRLLAILEPRLKDGKARRALGFLLLRR